MAVYKEYRMLRIEEIQPTLAKGLEAAQQEDASDDGLDIKRTGGGIGHRRGIGQLQDIEPSRQDLTSALKWNPLHSVLHTLFPGCLALQPRYPRTVQPCDSLARSSDIPV